MTKIKIKALGGPTHKKRETLANALFCAQIRVLRYFTIHDGYLALIEDDNHAEKLFSKDVVLTLEKLGFSPIIPIDMKAKLTLVFKKLDRQVVSESALEIEEEISSSFPDAQVEDIYVMKDKYIIKARFSDHATAKNIKEKGIYLFKVYVAPWQIEFERFTPLKQCMNCFAYGHLKTQCKSEKRARCTECGSNTHSFRDCKSSVKKCLNCGGAHRTFANSCPTRKEAMKISQEKVREKEKEKETKPYRAVAQKTAQETVQATTNAWKPLINQVRQEIKHTKTEPSIHLALPNDLSKEILVVLLHAHMQNIIAPEKGFRYHAKVALEANNLPALDLGESDSWGILKVIQPPSQTVQAQPEQSQPVAPMPQPVQAQAAESQLPQAQPTEPLPQTLNPQPAEIQTLEPQSVPPPKVTSAPPSIASTSRQSVRPKSITIPNVNELRDIPSDIPLTTPDAPPPTPNLVEHSETFTDDEGLERLMDGTATDPKHYGIRLFSENPPKYQYSDRFEIGSEIKNKRIKWLVTKREHTIMVTIKRLHKHLKEGNMRITNDMIEQCPDIDKLNNGYFLE